MNEPSLTSGDSPLDIKCATCGTRAPIGLCLAHAVTGLHYFCDDCSDRIGDREDDERDRMDHERREHLDEKD